MKNSSKILIAIISAVVLAGIVFFFWQRGLHLPRAQTPQAPGTFILKNQLVFAGYKTPEAALESMVWASMHGDYDAHLASIPPEEQAEIIKRVGSPARFKSQAAKRSSQLRGFEIMARKNVSSDNVELKIQIVETGGDYNQGETNLVIFTAVKIGNEWKFDRADYISDYETNWNNSGDVVTFAN